MLCYLWYKILCVQSVWILQYMHVRHEAHYLSQKNEVLPQGCLLSLSQNNDDFTFQLPRLFQIHFFFSLLSFLSLSLLSFFSFSLFSLFLSLISLFLYFFVSFSLFFLSLSHLPLFLSFSLAFFLSLSLSLLNQYYTVNTVIQHRLQGSYIDTYMHRCSPEGVQFSV